MDHPSFFQAVLREAGFARVVAGMICVEYFRVCKRRKDVIPDRSVGIDILRLACESEIAHIRTREFLQKPGLGEHDRVTAQIL